MDSIGILERRIEELAEAKRLLSETCAGLSQVVDLFSSAGDTQSAQIWRDKRKQIIEFLQG